MMSCNWILNVCGYVLANEDNFLISFVKLLHCVLRSYGVKLCDVPVYFELDFLVQLKANNVIRL